jgi:hypothetical protein
MAVLWDHATSDHRPDGGRYLGCIGLLGEITKPFTSKLTL